MLLKDDYDQTLLKKFNCWNHEEKIPGWENTEESCNSYWASIEAGSTALHLPEMADNYEHTQKMLHYTFIFQVFVFMQIFNLINSRKIAIDEWNVFKYFFNNPWFICIFFLTILIQVILVEFGGTAVKTYALNMT